MRKIKSAVVIIFFPFLGTSNANAATISYDYVIDTAAVYGSALERYFLADIPLFNPDLGTLSAVEHVFNSKYQLHATYDLTPMQRGGYVLSWGHYTFTGALFNPASIGIQDLGFADAKILLAGEANTFATSSFFGGGIIQTEPSATVEFVGQGNFKLYVLETFYIYGECLGNPCVDFSAGGSAQYAGKVSYHYTPTSVPEPSNWLFMLTGFGLVGLGTRAARVRYQIS